MQEKRVKPGWNALGIIGMIYAPMGLMFLGAGLLARYLTWGRSEVESRIFLYVFGSIGGLFFLIGAAFLWVELRRRRAMRRAVELGRVIMADVTGIQQLRNVSTTTGHPWVVECQFTDPDTGVLHACVSRYVKFNPSAALEGKQIPVYFDPDGGKHGIYVDIAAVLPEVEVHS